MENEKNTKPKNTLKKFGMRNLVILCAVLIIGGAIGINYLLYSDTPDEPNKDVDINLDDTNINDTLENDNAASDYFAQTILSRQQARDEAIEVLQTVVQNTNALPETVESALADITKIAEDIECESRIETLVKAKGFEECIAVINEGSATVIVKTDELLASEVAQINEIVYEQSGILPTGLKIIEKN